MALVVGSGNIIHGHSDTTDTAPRKGRYVGGNRFTLLANANGPNTKTTHLARLITQSDWGFINILIHVRKRYYNPSSNGNGWYRLTGYYSTFSLTHLYGSDPGLLQMQNFGPGGSDRIHESSRGGYYRDAWGRDLYANVGYYNSWGLDFYVNDASGFIKDNSVPLTDVYPAAFGSNPSQSQADNWDYGRGCWFNATAGTVGH